MVSALRRLHQETWLDAALRLADDHDLQREVYDTFCELSSAGLPDEEAALEACYEWNVLPYERDKQWLPLRRFSK